MSETIENAKLLLAKWRNDAEVLEKAHYWSATYSRMYNYFLGIPLVIITTFTASDIFVKLSKFVETIQLKYDGIIQEYPSPGTISLWREKKP